MDFAFTPEEEQLRARVRAFIGTHAGKGRASCSDARLQRKLPGDDEWRAVSWPSQWGGQNGSVIDQFIVEEEFCRAGYRIGGGGTAAPHLLAWGSEAQKRELLPPILRGEAVVAPAFTEAGCGTDLAAVSLAATRHESGYCLRGTKLYVSVADQSTHFMLLARTDPASERHRGLSVFLVDARSPGIHVERMDTVQSDPPPPMGTVFGETALFRVEFHGVDVPVETRLGPEGEGWRVLNSHLSMDRVSARAYVGYVQQDEAFLDWLRSDEGACARKDPLTRDAAAALWIEHEVCRLMALRTLSKAAQGEATAPESFMENAWGPEHCIRSVERIGQVIGPGAQLLRGSAAAIADGLFAHNLLSAFQSAVHHGGVTVMRDLLAKSMGLVRAPRAGQTPVSGKQDGPDAKRR